MTIKNYHGNLRIKNFYLKKKKSSDDEFHSVEYSLEYCFYINRYMKMLQVEFNGYPSTTE